MIVCVYAHFTGLPTCMVDFVFMIVLLSTLNFLSFSSSFPFTNIL